MKPTLPENPGQSQVLFCQTEDQQTRLEVRLEGGDSVAFAEPNRYRLLRVRRVAGQKPETDVHERLDCKA